MNDLRFFIELLLWLGAASGAQNGYFPKDGREPTRRQPTTNVRGVLLRVNAAWARRGARSRTSLVGRKHGTAVERAENQPL